MPPNVDDSRCSSSYSLETFREICASIDASALGIGPPGLLITKTIWGLFD